MKGKAAAGAPRVGSVGVQIIKLQQANQAHRYSRQIRHTGYSRQSGTPAQQANQAHRVQQAKQTHQAASKRSKMGQEAREERVQREREVGGEERIGGRMPEETQRVVREDQSGKGSIWRKEEVRPGGLEAGSVKEKGPRRQMDGSRRGRTSAQAM
jgi:hypothetical protein